MDMFRINKPSLMRRFELVSELAYRAIFGKGRDSDKAFVQLNTLGSNNPSEIQSSLLDWL
ncbi:MAG: hypothetical protein ACTSR7_16185 [Promethearchaeota archaeon]